MNTVFWKRASVVFTKFSNGLIMSKTLRTVTVGFDPHIHVTR